MDSDRKLTDALEPYQDKISSEKKLSKKQLNKFKHIVDLQHKIIIDLMNILIIIHYLIINMNYILKINDYTAHVDQLYKKN